MDTFLWTLDMTQRSSDCKMTGSGLDDSGSIMGMGNNYSIP